MHASQNVANIITSLYHPALNEVFSLDTFSISIIPVAIRSFVHHFYPAYGFPLVEFAAKSDPERVDTSVEDETNVSSKR
jgi:hypothetical protein